MLNTKTYVILVETPQDGVKYLYDGAGPNAVVTTSFLEYAKMGDKTSMELKVEDLIKNEDPQSNRKYRVAEVVLTYPN